MWTTLKRYGAAAVLGAAGLAASTAAGFSQDTANVTMFGADTAFILPRGDMFVGATLSDPRGGISGNDMDGDMSFGAGFGNPIDAVGFEIDVNITGLDPFLESGNLTLKASRALLLRPNHAVFGAVSASNLAPWGDDKLGTERWNATVSGMTQVQGGALIHPVMWTLGYGSDAVLSTPGSSLTEEGFFAGLGVGLTKSLGASVSGTENQLNLGLGFKVPGIEGVNVSYGLNDITDNMDRKQHMFTVSYSLSDVFGGS